MPHTFQVRSDEDNVAHPSANSPLKLTFMAAVSAVIPGAGHLLLGAKLSGLILLFAYCVLNVLYWPLRLPTTWPGLVCGITGTLVLCTVASWRAMRTSSRGSQPGSRLWLLLVIPLALAGFALNFKWQMRASGVRAYNIPSTAMANTIKKGDHIVADLRFYQGRRPKRGDLILFRRGDTILIKRVIATGGDNVAGRDGEIFLNGRQLDEPYVLRSGKTLEQFENFEPVQIPEGFLFVLGDNRNVSFDSRMPEFGLVDERTVVAKALYLLPRDDNDRLGARLP